jgi:predicted DCC family thiol-disulfide oxidoreductase YuxK
MPNPTVIVYYDGHCPFCNQWVQRLLKWDSKATFHFASQQSSHFASLLKNHPEIQNINSIIIHHQTTNQEKLYTHSDAILFALSQLPYPIRLLSHLQIIPKSIRDTLYTLIAKNRYRLYGRFDSCPAPPPPQHRQRFLD